MTSPEPVCVLEQLKLRHSQIIENYSASDEQLNELRTIIKAVHEMKGEHFGRCPACDQSVVI